MTDDAGRSPDPTVAATLQLIAQRLARLERHLDLPPLQIAEPPRDTADAMAHASNAEATAAEASESATAAPRPTAEPATEPATEPAVEPVDGELEFVVGQNWFAGVGIIVLTCGVGFALSLPLAGFAAIVPSLAGWAVAAALLLIAYRWRTSFELVAGYFRGAGMALLYFATLRLFFFGATHALDIESAAGRLLLVGVVVANVSVALRLQSARLFGLALATGLVTAVAVGTPEFVFVGVALLLSLAVWAVLRYDWPGLMIFIIPASFLAHLIWLVNRPWSDRELTVLVHPVGMFVVLGYALIIATASLKRREASAEDPLTVVMALLNCGSYGLFALATMHAGPALFGPAHLVAAAVFLTLAMVFWMRVASKLTTFLYAMTGYLSLSVAIVALTPMPDAFIWLSGQSLLVVATALWFRSRLIVIGNFFIFVAIVIAYMAVATSESGISIGFGIVALVTARVLRWQQNRLSLTTEMMRNAYLASAFVVFPYALYHLVPRAYVTLSWVGAAVTYYVMNLIVQSPKYRWMGHLTLLGTALYVIVIGIFQLAPAYRIASFLVLGTVLLIVSLLFTWARARRKRAS